ncbi:right-handed parallel beta-helix repeat-containing protein [Gimesia sp.]|uniref:right-handed parallel beta-helix repeat-containing protein n=1 Tax=Gimesia sp. TaxID=2024833 RepID=UPI003A8D4446
MTRICLAITMALFLWESSDPLAAGTYNPISLGFDDSVEDSFRESPASVTIYPEEQNYEADVSELFGAPSLFGRYHPHFGYRHQLGDTIGRQGGLSSFDLFVPLLEDHDSEWLYFVDARVLLDDQNNNLGSNLGLGVRRYLPGIERTLGGYVYYDSRDTGVASFQQISGGIDLLGNNWDMRLNWYAPTGETRTQWGQSISGDGTYRFVGHYLRTGAVTRYYQAAMTGIDAETGYKFYSGMNTDFRVYGGAYFFQAEESKHASGWKTRVESRISDMVSLNVSVQHDTVFQTTVNFAASIQWPSLSGLKDGPRSNLTAYDRLGESPERLRSIVVDNQTVEDPDGLYLINPATGNPYYFMHVSPGGNSDGSYEDPYATLAKAFADPRTQQGDLIVYDHRNTSESGTFILGPDTRVLSTGPAQYINTQFGVMQLPDSNSGLTPQITGNFVMENNTELNGFDLFNSSGPSITASGTGNILVSRNTITNSFNGSAVSLTGLTGPVTFSQTPINKTNGTGVTVLNSNADITFTNSPVTAVNGNGIDLQNTGGTIRFGQITTTNGDISANIVNNAADVTIDSLSSTDAATSGLVLNNQTGSLTLNGGTFSNSGVAGVQIINSQNITLRDITIDTPVSNATGASILANGVSHLLVSNNAMTHSGAGTAISLSNLTGPVTFDQTSISKSDGLGVSINGGTGDVTFTDSAITNTNGDGLDIQNVTGTMLFGQITTTNGTNSIYIDNTAADITIAGLNSTDAGNSAININDLTGSFTLNSGTITDSVAAGVNINDSTNITLESTTINTALAVGSGSSILADGIGNLTVSNGAITHEGTGTAVSLSNLTGPVSFSSNAVNKTGGLGVSITGGTGDVTFTNSAITNTDGNGLDVQTAAGTMNFGQISTTNGTNSVSVSNSAADITIANLISTDAANNAVLVNNLTGSFALNGGTFTNSGAAGAQITNSSNVSIQNVTIDTPGTHGIFAQNINNFNFSGNFIDDAAQDGIHVENASGTATISDNRIRSILSAFDNAISVTTNGNINLDMDDNIISSLLTIGNNGIDVTTLSGDATIRIRGNRITSIANGFGDAIHYTGNSSGTMNTTITGNTIQNDAGLFNNAIDVRYNAGSANTTISANTIDSNDLVNVLEAGIYLDLNTTGSTETFIEENIISADAVAGLFNDGISVFIEAGTDNIVHINENEIGKAIDLLLNDSIEVRMSSTGNATGHVQVNDNELFSTLGIGLNVSVLTSDTLSMQIQGNDTGLLSIMNFNTGLGSTLNIEDLPNLSTNNNGTLYLLLGLGTVQNTTDWLLP